MPPAMRMISRRPGIQHHERRVAGNAERLAPFLRAGLIAIEVHRHEQLALGDEVGPREDRGLELLAGRAPARAPIQQHGLVRGLRRGERRPDVTAEPVDARRVGMAVHGRGGCHCRLRYRRSPGTGGYQCCRGNQQCQSEATQCSHAAKDSRSPRTVPMTSRACGNSGRARVSGGAWPRAWAGPTSGPRASYVSGNDRASPCARRGSSTSRSPLDRA